MQLQLLTSVTRLVDDCKSQRLSIRWDSPGGSHKKAITTTRTYGLQHAGEDSSAPTLASPESAAMLRFGVDTRLILSADGSWNPHCRVVLHSTGQCLSSAVVENQLGYAPPPCELVCNLNDTIAFVTHSMARLMVLVRRIDCYKVKENLARATNYLLLGGKELRSGKTEVWR